jgi:hypothetical protein
MLTEFRVAASSSDLKFRVANPEPSPFNELKTICRGLFVDATHDLVGKPTMTVSDKSSNDPSALKDIILRAVQSNRQDTAAGRALLSMLTSGSPQKIIEDMTKATKLDGYYLWNVMRQITEFQTTKDPSVYLAILGQNIQ